MQNNLKKQAVIIVNAYTRSEAELHQPRRIREELEKLGVKTEIVRNLACNLKKTDGADFIVYLDKDCYTARVLEKKKRLFNRAEAIETCDDKMLTHIALEGFPMPKTIAGPLCYTKDVKAPCELLNEVETLGYPVIVKECHGSLGKGVFKADNREELERLAEQVREKPHLFQEFIQESSGTDLRVLVVGGKVEAMMKRVSNGDFRSNAGLGGSGEKVEGDEAAKTLCERVAAKLKLDYCGVDLLYSKRGYLVCEVNSNAFFRLAEEVTGKNIAKAYAKYMYKEIYG